MKENYADVLQSLLDILSEGSDYQRPRGFHKTNAAGVSFCQFCKAFTPSECLETGKKVVFTDDVDFDFHNKDCPYLYAVEFSKDREGTINRMKELKKSAEKYCENVSKEEFIQFLQYYFKNCPDEPNPPASLGVSFMDHFNIDRPHKRNLECFGYNAAKHLETADTFKALEVIVQHFVRRD